MPPKPKLPDPEEVMRLLNSMRESVVAAYDTEQETIDQAKSMIELAREEQKRLVEAYPMFFSQDMTSPDVGYSGIKGVPTIEAQNQMLRILAEHPSVTRRRTAKLINYSESWVSSIIKYMNTAYDRPVVAFGKSGRMRTYNLTEFGTQLINNGGIGPCLQEVA